MNTAWGQAVLLLDMMTRMYPDFKWEQGMLKPMGSHSMVSVALTHCNSRVLCGARCALCTYCTFISHAKQQGRGCLGAGQGPPRQPLPCCWCGSREVGALSLLVACVLCARVR